jgi:hypothetical protein
MPRDQLTTGVFAGIDKFCIDQNNIQDSLKYLPVFVMGSRKMLVLVGPTYAPPN